MFIRKILVTFVIMIFLRLFIGTCINVISRHFRSIFVAGHARFINSFSKTSVPGVVQSGSGRVRRRRRVRTLNTPGYLWLQEVRTRYVALNCIF